MANSFRVRRNSRFARALGQPALDFLTYALEALTRLLPHVDTMAWTYGRGEVFTQAPFVDQRRRELALQVRITLDDDVWYVGGRLLRRRAPAGVGAIPRTIDLREQDIAFGTLMAIDVSFRAIRMDRPQLFTTLKSQFDERVVATHLKSHFGLQANLADWFTLLRELAEQTYENKPQTFGCLIDTDYSIFPAVGAAFPAQFLSNKKYKVLSDGFRTAYWVSTAGALCGFRRSRASVPVDAGPVFRRMPGRVDAVTGVSTIRLATVNGALSATGLVS